ncbi:MAG: hypothetical protein LBT90_00630 [Holosporaceae bacterium]|nr:hypothetical protein [Holosporaceae bacterium]
MAKKEAVANGFFSQLTSSDPLLDPHVREVHCGPGLCSSSFLQEKPHYATSRKMWRQRKLPPQQATTNKDQPEPTLGGRGGSPPHLERS